MSEQVKLVGLEAKKKAELAKLDYQSLMQIADFETVKWSEGRNFDRSFGEEIERRLKVCDEVEALRARVRELEDIIHESLVRKIKGLPRRALVLSMSMDQWKDVTP